MKYSQIITDYHKEREAQLSAIRIRYFQENTKEITCVTPVDAFIETNVTPLEHFEESYEY